MKIIFLDFDGVIRMPIPGGGPRLEAEFCPERMRRVARLAKKTAARIVIASDWRNRYDREGMEALLSPHIPPDLLHEDWRTPVLFEEGSTNRPPRGAEIVAWLSRNAPVESVVILDDMASANFPLLKNHLVSCCLLDGFTEARLASAAEILENLRLPTITGA